MAGQRGAIELVVEAQKRSIGVGSVLRVLPTAKRRSVGPFVFLDHMSTIGERPRVLDVEPHPHIGIATLTYLFEGAILHRDSIGSNQVIGPGDVNWMTAGRGIVHSERTPNELRDSPPSLFGVQCWIALPPEAEEAEPLFAHYSAREIPVIRSSGAQIRLLAGTGFGQESPVAIASPLLCAALELDVGASVHLPPDHQERALVVLSGEGDLGDEPIASQTMVVLAEGSRSTLIARNPLRGLLVGGPQLGARRFMDWNFVATSQEHIDRAKARYRQGLLGQIPGEAQNLPLPEDVA